MAAACRLPSETGTLLLHCDPLRQAATAIHPPVHASRKVISTFCRTELRSRSIPHPRHMKRWTPKFGQAAKVGSRPSRRSLECHGRDGLPSYVRHASSCLDTGRAWRGDGLPRLRPGASSHPRRSPSVGLRCCHGNRQRPLRPRPFLSGVVGSTFSGLFFGALYLAGGRNLWLPLLALGFLDPIALAMVYLGLVPEISG